MSGITRRSQLAYDGLPMNNVNINCRGFCCFIGKLYVTGGYLNHIETNKAHAIDVNSRSGTVTSLPPMQEARSSHTIAAAGSLVFVFGGWIKRGEKDERTSSCELFDSCTNK